MNVETRLPAGDPVAVLTYRMWSDRLGADPDVIGRTLRINGRDLVNFASCNYLGLALDPRLAEGAAEGAKRYGTGFPTSRAFVSMGYLDELEAKLETLFGYPCLLTTSTSLGHIAGLPVLVDKEDAIILDHQVHNSVSVATQLLKSMGCPLHVVRHNDLEALEKKLTALSATYKTVWYMADGIYSMYGDKAPVVELNQLLDRHQNFQVYVDDAHGMSWLGKRGEGHVLSEAPLHERMHLITSLGKSFGSIGGAMVFATAENKAMVKSTGGPLIFSSPMPGSIIGASIAAAEIHLSDELPALQKELQERLQLFRGLAMELGLPLLGKADTPIFFIPAGNPDSCFALCKKMMAEGYYQSPAVFPSVPINNAGIRFTMTNRIPRSDIEQALRKLAPFRKQVMQSFGMTEDSIRKWYKGIEFLANSPAA